MAHILLTITHMTLQTRFLTLSGALLLAPICAMADPTIYSSSAAYSAAAGSTTDLSFDSFVSSPNGLEYVGGTFTDGDVTFTDNVARLFILGSDFYYSAGLTSSYLNNNYYGTVVGVDFTDPVYSFGMNVATLGFANDDNMQLTLSTGQTYSVPLTDVLFNSNAYGFFGVTSSVAITSITITDPSESIVIGDFSYSAAPAPSVPDSGNTFITFGGALVVLAVLLRRQSPKSVSLA